MERSEEILIETCQRAKSNQKRLDNLENKVDEIQGLTISVNKLAINMEKMLEEQQRQRQDVDALKQEPGKHWNSLKLTVLTTITSTVAGALAVGLIFMLANVLK